ncbi:MAG: vWA domain-containing protein [Planctomycetota bacterium]
MTYTRTAENDSPAKESKGASEGWVSISNGKEFSLVPRRLLAEFEEIGFYRPKHRGRTIISRDGRLFEVAIEQSEAALASGYEDVLLREATSLGKGVKKESPSTTEADAPAASLPFSGDPLAALLPPARDAGSNGAVGKSMESTQVGGPALSQSVPGPRSFAFVAEAVEQVEKEAEERRMERVAEIEAAASWKRPFLKALHWFDERREAVIERAGSHGISVLIHVAILLVLSSLFLVTEKEERGVVLVSTSPNEELIVEEIQIETEPIEVEEPSESEPDAAEPVEEVTMEVTEVVDAPNFLASVKSDSIKPPAPKATPSTDPGSGQGKKMAKPTFFGSKFTARDYVFVIDNSNSMTRGRFETALLQLMLTVRQLTPKQRFYVIFYSDTAYGMMHPRPVPELQTATARNKVALEQWLGTVQLCLKTNGREAIALAFQMEPDVVYVLGDGAFTDGASKYYSQNPNKDVILHTRGMEVDEKKAQDFRRLAEAHRGTYKDVGVMPEGALLAKQFPRKRNNARGPVWGVKLPPRKPN